jgi:hypothetical protein
MSRPRNVPAIIQPITDPHYLIEYKLPCPELPATSIFNWPIFPGSKYRPYYFTPEQLKKAYDDYSCAEGTLEFHCKQNHIEYDSVLALQGMYPELTEYYWHAQEKHTEVWAQECEKIADNESRDSFKVTKITKSGDTLTYQQPNMVATRRDELRVKTRLTLMERLSARYRPKSETFNRSIVANVNLSVPVSKLGTMPIDGMIQQQGD